MTPPTSFDPIATSEILAALSQANKNFMARYPGESNRRQAVQTVYGGAHLFKADSASKLGEVALRSLKEYAPDAKTLAQALGIAHAKTPSSRSSPSGRGGREAPGEGQSIDAP